MPPRELRTRPQADAGIREIHHWLYVRNEAAANRFLEALDTAFQRIQTFPDSGVNVTSNRIQGLQLTPIGGFANYLILFRTTDNAVEILDVFHGAQDRDIERT